MATFKCNDPIYTILRNGKVLTMSARPATAVSAITDDASRNVCPPDCCITGFNIDIDSFDVLIATVQYQSLSIRVTVTSGGNDYSTAWAAAAATNTIDITGLIVEFGDWENGNTICVEYSYDQDTVIPACCATVVIPTSPVFNEDATYQLSEVVTECAGGVFDLAFQNPDGGVTVDPTGEMVIPELAEDETVFVTYSCDDCVSELLILTAKNVVPLEGLRLTYTPGNLPANNLAAWNAFFDLPANGTAFTSMSTTGDEVTLTGGAGITLKDGLFSFNVNVLKVEDDVSCVIAALNDTFSGCTAFTTVNLPALTTMGAPFFGNNFANCTALTTVNLPALTTINNSGFFGCTALVNITLPALTSTGSSLFSGCTNLITATLSNLITASDNIFNGCTSLTTVSMPLTTDISTSVFQNCNAITNIDLTSCTNFGGTSGNDNVFNLVVGATVTISVPIVLKTCDGGNPDGDLVYLSANNTATFNYI